MARSFLRLSLAVHVALVPSLLAATSASAQVNQIGLEIPPTHKVSPPSGTATITGFVHCQQPADVVLTVSASQTRGKKTVAGTEQTIVACEGRTLFTLPISPPQGKFRPGEVTLLWFEECLDQECGGEGGSTATFQLKVRPSV
jgi:hypothetical protein